MKRQNSIRWTIIAVVMVIILLFIVSVFIHQILPVREDYIHLPAYTDTAAVSGSAGYTDKTTQPLHAVQLEPENVVTVVQTLNRPAAYTLLAVTEIFANGRTLTTEIRHSVRENLSATVRTVGTESTHIVRAGGQEYLWTDTSPVKIFADLGEDAAAGLAAYETVYTASPQDITEAYYTLWEGFSCICFTVQDTELGLFRQYHVDIDTGLLIHAETWNTAGTVLYRMQTNAIIRDTPAAEEFYLPDGTLPDGVSLD